MTLSYAIGILGSAVLVSGAAWPAKKVSHPGQSAKNWLFALGNLCMLIYAIAGYRNGGEVFFVFLQVPIGISTVLMMLKANEKMGTVLITVISFALVVWSLFLLENMGTILFVLGLCGISLGYVMTTGTAKRNVMLALGSALIALYSYIVNDWVFLWLNVFFATFSGYYAIRLSSHTQ